MAAFAPFDRARFEREFLGNAPSISDPPPPPVGAKDGRRFLMLAAALIAATVVLLVLGYGQGRGVHLPTTPPATPSACELHWQNDYAVKGTPGALSHDTYLAQCNSGSDARLIEKGNQTHG